jgi:hypothetical protein
MLGAALGLAPAGAGAQGVQLRLEPSRTEIAGCQGESLEVAIVIANPSRAAIGGYQLFLRFPADHFEAVEYRAGAIDAFFETAGPLPLGSGFKACTDETADPWGDGAGEDVVAVTASAFAAGHTEPFRETQAEVGRLIFRPKGLATSAGGAAFTPNTESCHVPFDQTTKVFDADGGSLLAGAPGGFTVAVTDAGPGVQSLQCIDGDDAVLLLWTPPPLNEIAGYKIYRNGEQIAQFSVNFISEYPDRSAPTGTLRYEVAVIRRSGSEGCRAACSLERGAGVRFTRGDANRDQDIDIGDPIAILQHLFLGVRMSCLDAGDADDDGHNDLTDGIFLLTFLFQAGVKPSPPAPFPNPGSDPTPDGLGCER